MFNLALILAQSDDLSPAHEHLDRAITLVRHCSACREGLFFEGKGIGWLRETTTTRYLI